VKWSKHSSSYCWFTASIYGTMQFTTEALTIYIWKTLPKRQYAREGKYKGKTYLPLQIFRSQLKKSFIFSFLGYFPTCWELSKVGPGFAYTTKFEAQLVDYNNHRNYASSVGETIEHGRAHSVEVKTDRVSCHRTNQGAEVVCNNDSCF